MTSLIATGMPRRRALLGLGAALCLGGQARADGGVLRVGPGHAVRSLAAAAKLAHDGLRIEVEAGDYLADVASWNSNDLSLVAVGGRVRLIANGAHAQGKGLFVIGGERVSVSGFDFVGATVPDTNGAGIRFERGSLRVSDCSFSQCEMGLLSNNDPDSRLIVENCEFAHAAARPGSGPAHLLYAGSIAQLTVQGCYFHHGRIGHLIKSRAALNHILYNRLSDEAGGRASYELEFPNGGRAVVLGNLIQQSAQTENPHLIAFGAEGYTHATNELWLAHNTLVDERLGGGIYLRVAPGAVKTVRVVNNLLVGSGRFSPEPGWDARNNPRAGPADLEPGWVLKPVSPLRGRTADPGTGPDGLRLRPGRQYQPSRGSRVLAGPAVWHPGALQSP
jgi:hypothetical protein